MSKKDDIQKIYREVFNDSPEYIKMLFDVIYNDREGMLLTSPDGQPASIMLLRRFDMKFHDTKVPVAYIHGAATRRSQRGKGFMSRLIVDGLREAAARGDMMVTLIPASNALYYFYAQYGFTTVFYMKEQRFTSLHSFTDGEEDPGAYHPVTDTDHDRLWEAFNRFQLSRQCYILHTREDFRAIIEDNRIDGGNFVVMARDDEDLGPRIVSMAWAVKRNDLLVVTDLMGEDRPARLAALRQLRALNPEMPFLLYAPPTDRTGGRLMPRGMGRIVNVLECLRPIAAANPDLRLKIRVTDDFFPALNSHTFIMEKGQVRIDDSYSGRLDFDVTVDVLASVVFNSAATADIIGFPSVRPMISLMLD
ncbi:MAG: GNAT family N-acetyltransferase [Bacteroides sp.]|nr:GNAT family N-acetyltransferase [Bacteroides sp.]